MKISNEINKTYELMRCISLQILLLDIKYKMLSKCIPLVVFQSILYREKNHTFYF